LSQKTSKQYVHRLETMSCLYAFSSNVHQMAKC